MGGPPLPSYLPDNMLLGERKENIVEMGYL